jgi:hypothetical protein
MNHSAVTTFFNIKRAYNTSSTYNHQPEMHFMEIVALKQTRKASPSLTPSTKFGWDRIHLCQISRTSSIIWNLIQIDHSKTLKPMVSLITPIK